MYIYTCICIYVEKHEIRSDPLVFITVVLIVISVLNVYY